MDSTSGYGGYKKKSGAVVGPDLYRGVDIFTLLSYFDLPDNFTLCVVGSDGYQLNYTWDEINGRIPIYNETGAEIGSGNVTMIVAYEKNNESLGEDEGPLRIAFVSEEGYITSSKLWARSVSSLEIKV